MTWAGQDKGIFASQPVTRITTNPELWGCGELHVLRISRVCWGTWYSRILGSSSPGTTQDIPGILGYTVFQDKWILSTWDYLGYPEYPGVLDISGSIGSTNYTHMCL